MQSERIDLLAEENGQIWAFLQRYIDEQSVERLRIIRSPDQTIDLKCKIDVMDWVARHAEFLSPEVINTCVVTFKELYAGDQPQKKNIYINSVHSSEAVTTVIGLLQHSSMLGPALENESRLAILGSLLEPLLVNDYNLEKALQMDIVDLLGTLIGQTLEGFDSNKTPLHLKYVIRCITSCLRSEVAVAAVLMKEKNVLQVLMLLERVKDIEILANSAKLLRILLREEANLAKISNNTAVGRSVVNALLEAVLHHGHSEAVVVESLSAVRNYTKDPRNIEHIMPRNVHALVSVANDVQLIKARSVAVNTLKQIATNPDYAEHIKRAGETPT